MNLRDKPVHVTVVDAVDQPVHRLTVPFGALPDHLKLRLVCELLGDCYQPFSDNAKSFFAGGRRYKFDVDDSLKRIIDYRTEGWKVPKWVREQD